MNRINGFISAVNGILVLFLIGPAFVLSFHALAKCMNATQEHRKSYLNVG